MKTCVVFSLLALAGCAGGHDYADKDGILDHDGNINVAAFRERYGAPTPVDSLSARDQKQVCVVPDPIGPDLAPYLDGEEPTGGQFPCLVFDADVGGDDTCCGGDLRVQSCGAGLTCWKPAASAIGVCSRETFSRGTVCIDVESDHTPNCILNEHRDNAGQCAVAAFCGNGFFQLTCSGDRCSCYNYAALLSDNLPAQDICAGSADAALAAAQANCNLPNDFSFRHVIW